jgi:[NiFe] hydrogenase diaphorase moiety large subunit
MSQSASDFIDGLVRARGGSPTQLIQILRDIQERDAHIGDAAADQVAEALGLRRCDVDAVVEFYAFLSSTPRGRYDLLVSDNIVDRMAGSQAVLDRFCRAFGVGPGQTRADGLVSVAPTSCIGMSDQGPAALVNGRTLTRLDPQRVDSIVDLVERRIAVDDWPRDLFHVDTNIRRTDSLLERDFVLGSSLHMVETRGAESVLVELLGSGLRGLGGAGFKTGEKWMLCRDAHGTEPDTERYVVCNADEGEPGTFKDRILLQDYADLVFEGMTLCGRVIGARKGYLYLRAEYRYMLQDLEDTLHCRRASGLLGERILGVPGFDFDIEIHLGAGAYICGEESALIEALEGKRGVPRKRPPFPVISGYLGRPTVVNNVETFASAAKIAVRGGDCTAVVGTRASKGTKLLSISGDCERPGIYEFPWGMTLRRILEACGGADAAAVQVAGPAGHLIPASEFYRHIAYEDLGTGGSMMVFGRDRDVLDIVSNFTAFFRHESCGFCTPCRVGTSLLDDLVRKVRSGRGSSCDLEEMRRTAEVMRLTSHCGLGSTAANPVRDTLVKFADAYSGRLQAQGFEPAFDLDAALDEARALAGRDDAGAHLDDLAHAED